MDNLTHSLVGALIGQAGLKKKTGLAMPALVIGANLPDVDVSCFLWLDGVQHLGFRRGITHGPPALLLLPLLLAGILYGWDKWQANRGTRPEGRLPVHFGWLYALAFIACLTHPALDWMNSYGIRLLAPFSHRWFYGDVLFIVDIWLWLGMGFATWLSLRREKKTGGNWRRPARIALVAVLAYIGLNLAITAFDRAEHAGSLEPGAEYISGPAPITFWRREQILGRDREAWFTLPARFPGGPVGKVSEIPAAASRCQWPDTALIRRSDPDLAAFLTWSRAPYAERAESGDHVVIRDARFSAAGARARFQVELPDVRCQPPERK